MSEYRLFQTPPTRTAQTNTSGRFFFAKVTAATFNRSQPELVGTVNFQSLSDIGGIEKGIAYPLYNYVKNVPLVNEVILCLAAPSEDLEKTGQNDKMYYLSGVNIWNHPHHSGYTRESSEIFLDAEFKERADINPMLPFPGDIILEGRLGQSLRFSQSIPGKTPWIGSAGEPLVILSNGQISTSTGFEYISEDINKDFASLYLTSQQKLPLTPGNKLTQPLHEYDKPQAILTAGRLVLNARDNNLILSTPSALEASGRVVNIKAEDTLTSQATKIKLGEQADQRAILGDKMLSDLSAVLVELVKVTTALSSLGIAPLTAPAASFTERATRFIREVEQMKSNKVFIQK